MTKPTSDAESRASALMVTLRILHLALISTVAIYGAIAYFLTQQSPNATGARATPPPSMTWIFGAVGLLLIAVAIVLRKKGGGEASLYQDGQGQAQTDLAQAGSDGAKNQNGGSKYFSKCLIGWVMCEAAAILGLVLVFVHWKAALFMPFGAASAIALLLLAPRRRELDDMQKRFG